MFLLYLFSGLAIGFLIGFHDITAIFSAVLNGKKKRLNVSFFLVIIAVFFGVMLNREGTSIFIAELARVNQLKVGAVILWVALITAWVLRKKFEIISITHTVVGAIFGWLLFLGTGFPINKFLYIIVIWLLTPILGFLFASWYLSLSNSIIRRSKMHIFKIDRLFQSLTLIALFIAAFSLGANNSANITGVYLLVISKLNVQIINWRLPAEIILFFLAALSIISGFVVSVFYKKTSAIKHFFDLAPAANFSVLLAYTTVFFLFSSRGLQFFLNYIGIQGFELVPISTFHVLTAGLVGISYKKGYSIYKKEAFTKLSLASILAPVISGLATFIILLVIQFIVGKNVFVGSNQSSLLSRDEELQGVRYLFVFRDKQTAFDILVVLILGLIILISYVLYSAMQKRLKNEKKSMEKQALKLEAEKEFFLKELKYEQKTGKRLKEEIHFKNSELEKFVLQLIEKEKMLGQLKKILVLLKNAPSEDERKEVINEINFMITDSLNLAKERELFYSTVSKVHGDFIMRLTQQFSNLSESDKRLIAMLKLGLSSKEIATLSNISTKSVEMNRYRLRKKLNLSPNLKLLDFVKQI